MPSGSTTKMSSSRLPQLRSCCCICSLDVGTMLIAYWQLIICSVMFILEMYGLARSSQFTAPVDRTLVSGTILFIIFSTMFEVLFAVYLLVGLHRKKYHYAKVWCLVQVAHIIVSLVTSIFDIFFRFLDKSVSYHILDAFVLTALDLYFVLVVYSYYRSKKVPPMNSTIPNII